MYGLVHYGIKRMINEECGAATWNNVLTESGVGDIFEKAECYPDSETVALATGVCTVLGMSLSEVLQTYGRWWIGFAQRDYPQLFAKAGGSFKEFLQNMNETHRRVQYLFPESRAPQFAVTDVDDHTFEFRYVSERDGFYPFVTGLVQGLGEAFDTSMTIEYRGHADTGSGEVFVITCDESK